jgi:sporulation protein YlmC with PRC-barrel domain
MNKTKYLFIMAVSIFSLVVWSASSFGENWTEGTVQGYYMAKGWNTYEAGWLIGHRVYSPVGGDLGYISDLMIDRDDGHVALVILSDVPGFGDRFVAAPFGALERTGENIFQLNFGERDIAIANTFLEDRYAYELTRSVDTVGLSMIPSAIDPLWADTVYRFYGQTPYWTEGKTPRPDIMAYRTPGPINVESFFGTAGSSALLGATVESNGGKTVARISDLVIDSRDGRVALVVVDRVPERGDAMVAVPFGELSMSGNAYAFNFTDDRLAAAPTYNEFADANNPKRAEDIYRYFGLQPYWSEGGDM